ncbi:helix-turn-helix domain-containing protein [Caulobacter segnis]|uniref:HTH cro/C1-type domain-containing protein n=1 Tax=Caulobacter segnis TaxID=88688 RepID=A0A2W5XDD5_9CAUL|nr:helix-turn-helix transcriptional regulator [Caulobacter segnis]PZR35501.1 MAG: hypothetical protein DI526_07005 [Caulobacter segnis]
MSDDPDFELRAPTKAELAVILKTFRDLQGWTQETLAELAGVNVRTIQRVEDGKGGSADTLRAVARAVQAKDLDFLVRPQRFPTEAGLRRQQEAFDRENMMLPATTIASGRALEGFMGGVNMLSCADDELLDEDRESLADAAHLFDYLRDYLDVKGEISHQERLGVADDLDAILRSLRGRGVSVAVATRETNLTNDNWVDKRPWRVKIGYLALLPAGRTVTSLAVSRRIRLE